MKPENQMYYQMRITSMEYAMKKNFAATNPQSGEKVTAENIVSDAEQFFNYITKDDHNEQPLIKKILN